MWCSLLPQFDERAKVGARKEGRYLTRGLNASAGAAAGFAMFDPDEAETMGRDQKKPVILVRLETFPRRPRNLAREGILTAREEPRVTRPWSTWTWDPCVTGGVHLGRLRCGHSRGREDRPSRGFRFYRRKHGEVFQVESQR